MDKAPKYTLVLEEFNKNYEDFKNKIDNKLADTTYLEAVELKINEYKKMKNNYNRELTRLYEVYIKEDNPKKILEYINNPTLLM